ncbi:LysR family transcriptional regulator [uncultured Tateyamaria sp.]|uniref:LysR family transcriptional regulator n=1 Tax=uncultured Tateyamaria sp. TaxID=455651 RepID=UPI00261C0E7E|nr:LysR family transcriptional regulator [uncultured Tateyamaria sp.]
MKELHPIRVFLKVAELASFAAAARDLTMTPASVTRIVAKLEDTLGQQLLLRTTRHVSLTAAGARVATRYGPIVEDFDRASEEMAQAARPDRGRLRLNAPVSMGVRLLPGLIDSFRLAYPNIEVDMTMTDRLVDIMAEDCDLAIRISGPPGDLSTIWRKVCEVPRRAIAAPALFERMAVPDHPSDLVVDSCLSYSADGAGEPWVFTKEAHRHRLRAGTAVVSNNGDFLYALARAGGGIAVLPDFITHAGLESGAVIPVLPDWSVTSLWLTLYYPPYTQLPPLVATFSDFFEAYMRDMDGLDFSQAT